MSLSLLSQNDLHILPHKLKWYKVFIAGCFSIPCSESINVLEYKKKKALSLCWAFATGNLGYETYINQVTGKKQFHEPNEYYQWVTSIYGRERWVSWSKATLRCCSSGSPAMQADWVGNLRVSYVINRDKKRGTFSAMWAHRCVLCIHMEKTDPKF